MKEIDNWYYRGYTVFMKTAISIPDNLFKNADNYAKSHGFSRSQLYAKAIAHYLENHPADHITKQLDALYSQKSSKLNNTLSAMQFMSVKKEEW